MKIVRYSVLRAQLDRAVMQACRDGRVDQRRKRGRLQLDFVAELAFDLQPRSVSPGVRNAQSRLKLQLVGRNALRIQKELIQINDRKLSSCSPTAHWRKSLRRGCSESPHLPGRLLCGGT